jgi:hypothetical protein
MRRDEIELILKEHAKWVRGEGGERADLREANLREAGLREAGLLGADLREAGLREADLRGADLRWADLRGADLRWADLRGADLRWADLRGADLRWADLRGANLRWADLRQVDIDYSCWPLWCGSKGVVVDNKIAAQLAAHFCVLDCDTPEYQAARAAILDFAQTSHRANDLGIK